MKAGRKASASEGGAEVPTADAAGSAGVARWNPDELASIASEIEAIRLAALNNETVYGQFLENAHPNFRGSARNLLHYLALRSREIRPLQERLAALGLSSLGRSEGCVLASLEAVRAVVARLRGAALPETVPAIRFDEAPRLLRRHTEALLGPKPSGRRVRIMVTLPSEAADDPALVRELVASGMNCARINCAHDDAAVWKRMTEHVRRAQEELGRPCRIMMDLGGPKLRTGPLAPGPEVLRWRPRRDDLGREVEPALVWLTAAENPAPPPQEVAAVLPVGRKLLRKARRGDEALLKDARGRRRALRIVAAGDGGCLAESDRTAYVGSGSTVRLERNGEIAAEARVGRLPSTPRPIVLVPGDKLVLTRELLPGQPALRDPSGYTVSPARIACTLPEVFPMVRLGERIWFDDGKIGGVIESRGDDELVVRISQARPAGSRLAADKGINLPDSELELPALAAKDLEDLKFVAAHADLVGLSFAQRSDDVVALDEALSRRGGKKLGVVLKIETRRGFSHFPQLLLAACRRFPVGVMIARGDLAVECGSARLAEVQEEILWLSEAAHVPVVWATQVLETLAKTGIPSRAEITDAAAAVRAECVMLNKGPHVVEAVRMLDNILRRMQDHLEKKRSMLRPLRVAVLGEE